MRHIEKLSFVAITATALAFPAISSAALILVPNASFETPRVVDGEVEDPVPNWIVSGADVFTYNPASIDFSGADGDFGGLPPTAEGSQSLYIATTSTAASVTSAAPLITTEVDGVYQLIVAIGNGLTDDPSVATIEILADGISVASTFRGDEFLPEGVFTDVTVAYEATVAGQALTARLSHSGFGSVYFDNVRFDADPVPEPGAVAIIGLTVPALLRRRRRGH